jgi:RNA-directed DNA polymerase
MEVVLDKTNLQAALSRVIANKGAAGVDGMTVDQLSEYLLRSWPTIRQRLLNGHYKPQPVKRVYIPKPDGGERALGIPTVLDRFIQQALLQALSPRWEPTFSDHSYGFRPGRSAHQAVERAQGYITEGHGWVVDIDLEKFFDRVNHDMLMARVMKRISDVRIVKLIRACLNAGVMENGLVSGSDGEGTPQGGPLSPLLSNLVLDELDTELEKRGHKFVRYADDCNIYVRTERAGQRVMEGISDFITRKLQAQGERPTRKRVPRRGGSTGTTEVPGLQLHLRIETQTAHRAQGNREDEEASPGTDSANPGRGCQTDGRNIVDLPARVDRLLRPLPDTQRFGRSGQLDPPASACGGVEAVETRATSVQGTEASGRWQRPGGANRRERAQRLADQPKPGDEHRASKSIVGASGITEIVSGRPLTEYSTEPPDADPHVRWCGRGAAATPPPIPIHPRGDPYRLNTPPACHC